jgi:hypothetical protein
VVGLPGSNPGQHVIDTLAAASQVTLVMDPDAAEQATQLAAQTGLSKTRVLVRRRRSTTSSSPASPARPWCAAGSPKHKHQSRKGGQHEQQGSRPLKRAVNREEFVAITGSYQEALVLARWTTGRRAATT